MICGIELKSNELLKDKSETLKLLGIDNKDSLKEFLSLFLDEARYSMYLENNKSNDKQYNNIDNNESIVSSGDSNIENTTKEPEVDSTANDVITGDNNDKNESSANGTDKTNQIETTREDEVGKNQDGKQIDENEIVKSFKDKVLELRQKFEDSNKDSKPLSEMSIEELDVKIKEEASMYKEYMKLLKETHSFEKNAKDKNGVWTYIRDTVKSSIEAIDKIIESAKNKIDRYANSLEKNNVDAEKANKKIDEKYQEINNRTIKPLKEAKQYITEVKDMIYKLKDSSKEYEVEKIKKLAMDTLTKLDGDISGLKITNDVTNSATKLSVLFNDIRMLKEKAISEKVSYDDYGSETKYGKQYRDLVRAFEAEKSKLKIYADAISFYAENGQGKYYSEKLSVDSAKVKYNFDTFMSEANKASNFNNVKSYNKIYNNNENSNREFKTIYNKYSKFFSLPEDQRQFYSVKDLPSYMKDNKNLFIDRSVINSGNEKLIEYHLARNTYNVLKAKGVSFQKRMFGGNNYKKNMEVVGEVFIKEYNPKTMTQYELNRIDNAISYLKQTPIYSTVEFANKIGFEFPNIYKMFSKYDEESKTESKIMNLTSVKFDDNGNIIVEKVDGSSEIFKDENGKYSGSEFKNSEGKLDYQKILADVNENYNVSNLNFLDSTEAEFEKESKSSRYVKNAKLKNTIVLNDIVKEAIKIHTLASIEDMIKMTSLTSNDDQFEDIWGIGKSNFDGDIKDIERLSQQGYLPRAAIVQALGSAIYKDIGFGFNKNVSYEVSEGIKTELGLYAIAVMEKTGILLNVDDDMKTYNVGSSTNEKIQALIRINNVSKFKKDEDGNFNIQEGVIYSEDLIELSKIMNHLYSFEDKSKPTTNKIEPRFNRTVRNGFQKVSQDTNRILNDYESVAHKFNPIAKDIYNIWSLDKNKAYDFVGIGTLSEIGVGKNPNGNTFNVEDALSKSSKFSNERLALDELMEFYEDNMIDKNTGEHLTESPEFYVPWDFTVSGRYMMDSKINMQSGKVATRYLIQSKQMDSSMKLSNGVFDDNEFNQFMVGIAQGFGTGIDKKTDDTAFRDLENIVKVGQDGSVKFKLNEDGSLSKAHKGFLIFRTLIDPTFVGSEPEREFVKSVEEFNRLNNLDATEDVNKAMKAVSQNNSDLINFFKDITHVGEETHTLTAMRALAELDKFHTSGSEVFNHTFTTEADDITSGMILTLMGLGTQKAREFLEKGGVYTEEAIAFWNGTISELRNSIDSRYNKDDKGNYVGLSEADNSLHTILSSYNGYLTHGFLAEFGKLMDTDTFKDNVVSILQSADKDVYTDKLINDRVHFKDFYNTVAKKSQEKLEEIKKDIFSHFVKEEDKANYLKENKFTVDTVNKIAASYSSLPFMIRGRYIKNAVAKAFSKRISAMLNSKQYDIFDSILTNFKKFGRTSITEQSFRPFDKNNELSYRTVFDDVISSLNKLPDGSSRNYLLKYEFKDDNGKAQLIRQFAKSLRLKVDYVKGGSKEVNNELAIKFLNEFLRDNVKDERSYQFFVRTFRNSYSRYVSRKLINNLLYESANYSEGKSYYNNENTLSSVKSIANEILNFQTTIKKYKDSTGDFKTFENYDMVYFLNMFTTKVQEASLIKIAGNLVSRNMAKNPVMTFIYGSSINTIKKNIANIIGKEAMYNKFIEYGKNNINILNLMSSVEKFDLDSESFALKNILINMLDGDANTLFDKQFMKLSEDNMSLENMTQDEKSEAISKGDLSGLIVDENMMQPIYQASRNTYGESFGETFDQEFEDITKSRELLKANEIVRYSIFKHKLDSAFKELAIEKGLIDKDSVDTKNIQFKLTKADVDAINKKLEKDGFGHSVEDSNGARQSLNKQVAGPTGKIVTISFDSGREDNKTGYSSFSGSFKTDTENTGAAPVTIIHQIDGRKIGLALEGTGMLNIYDAFYSSSNKLHETSDRMNEEFLNTVEGYSAIRTSIKEVEHMILSMGKDEIVSMLNSIATNDKEFKIIEEAMLKINKDYKIFEFDSIGNPYFSEIVFSNKSFDMFDNINSSISQPVDVLVRHNQLGDDAKGHKGTAFNHEFDNADAGLVMSLFSDIINSARLANIRTDEYGLDVIESNLEIVKYLNESSLDSTYSDNIIIERNEEAYKENLAKIKKVIKGLGSRIDNKLNERFNKILDDFNKCISG